MKLRNIVVFIAIIFSVLAFVASFIVNESSQNEIDYWKQRDSKHQEKIMELEYENLLDDRRIDTLTCANDVLSKDVLNLHTADSLNRKEIKRLQGKFDHMNSNELQNEMIKKYERSGIRPR